jgi:hypothetical protein
LHCSLTISLIIFPLALIFITINICQSSLTLKLTISPITLIDITLMHARCPCHFTISISFAIQNLSLINRIRLSLYHKSINCLVTNCFWISLDVL